jgi:hypothetical protein
LQDATFYEELVQFLFDADILGSTGMVEKLLYYADAAAEAKEHRHGSVVLKAWVRRNAGVFYY